RRGVRHPSVDHLEDPGEREHVMSVVQVDEVHVRGAVVALDVTGVPCEQARREDHTVTGLRPVLVRRGREASHLISPFNSRTPLLRTNEFTSSPSGIGTITPFRSSLAILVASSRPGLSPSPKMYTFS